MSKAVLGISAFFHDSAAALLVDGEIVATAQEERFSRIKHDASFPLQSVRFVLDEAGIEYDALSAVAFYEKPYLKFERLLETYHAFAPQGLGSFLKAMPVWIKEKLFFRRTIRRHFSTLGSRSVPLYFPEHHLSHAASAFYPSPYKEAAILTIDGVGEWATTCLSHGQGNTITVLREQHFPHSLGLLYSAFTYYLGFEVNGGEYKLMGLAAYGDPHAPLTQQFVQAIHQEMVDIREDGSFLLNMRYFRYATHLRMTHDERWRALFGLSRRNPEDPLEPVHAHLAWAIQHITEEVTTKLAQTVLHLTKTRNLAMAGGVALNSVANGKLMDIPAVENLWIQPAAGDAGGALGAAYAVWHISQGQSRTPASPDAMHGACLGPAYRNKRIQMASRKYPEFSYQWLEEEALIRQTVAALEAGKVVGWFQGRMEFGPRALGNRSILADPRASHMQQKINHLIKFRESFRPFAPSVPEEDISEYFDLKTASPYMLLVRPVRSERCTNPTDLNGSLIDRLGQVRSDIPAVTHVDYSARIQTVRQATNPRYWKLLQAFKQRTGYGLLVNTSFNIKDEPIVCTPEDALRCFQKTGMDILVMNQFIFYKTE